MKTKLLVAGTLVSAVAVLIYALAGPGTGKWPAGLPAASSKTLPSPTDEKPAQGLATAVDFKPARPTQLRAAALPAPGTPVALFHDELKRRADNGDAKAACRLAAELLICGAIPGAEKLGGNTEGTEDAEQGMRLEQGMSPEEAVAFAQARQQHQRQTLSRLNEAKQRCSGITSSQMTTGATYLRRAALAGVPEAMVRYADGHAFDGSAMFALLRHPLFESWKREAPRMLERALLQGEPAAVFQLYMAYGDDYSLIGGLMVDDPEKAARYGILMHLLRGKSGPTTSELSGEAYRRVEAEARRMHRDIFQGRTVAEGEMTRSIRPLTPMVEYPEHGFCE